MSLTETQKEALGAAVAAVLFVGAAGAWWAFYVQPRDQFLGEVMACMDDGTQAEYDRCAKLVSVSDAPERPQ